MSERPAVASIGDTLVVEGNLVVHYNRIEAIQDSPSYNGVLIHLKSGGSVVAHADFDSVFDAWHEWAEARS